MFESKMFGSDLLNKLSDAIPADLKEKALDTVKEKLGGNAIDLKSSAMEKLGLTKPVVSKSSSVTSPEAVKASAVSDDETADFAFEQPEAAEDDENR
jgi:hypothetical protein